MATTQTIQGIKMRLSFASSILGLLFADLHDLCFADKQKREKLLENSDKLAHVVENNRRLQGLSPKKLQHEKKLDADTPQDVGKSHPEGDSLGKNKTPPSTKDNGPDAESSTEEDVGILSFDGPAVRKDNNLGSLYHVARHLGKPGARRLGSQQQEFWMEDNKSPQACPDACLRIWAKQQTSPEA